MKQGATAPIFHTFAMWRFLAALLVMAYHFMHYSQHAVASARWFEHMLPLLDMFFMVSGYLLYDRYRDKLAKPGTYFPFLFKRLARLYPLHLATTGFFILVALAWHFGIIQSNAGALRYDWSMLPVNLLLMQAWGIPDTLTFNYVSWSLSAEWFCYLMMPVVLVAASRFGLAGLVATAAVFYVGVEYAIAQDWTLGKFVADTKTWGAYRAFAAFCLGAGAVLLVDRRPFPIRSHIWGWLLMGILVAMMFADMNFYVIMGGMVIALALSAAAEHDNPHGMAWMRPLLPMLAVSFGIYLWHPIVETVLLSLVWNRFLAPIAPFNIEWFMVVAGVVSIAIAMVSHFAYEKPVGNYLIGRFEARRKRRLAMEAVQAGE